MQRKLFVLTLSIFLLSFALNDAHAGSLKEYKEQKHNRRKRVDAGSCEPEYIRTCQADCAPGNASCMKDCETQAPGFCKARGQKRTRKQLEMVAKGASLGVGALGVILDRPMGEVGPDGTQEISPYSIIWNETEFVTELGGGALSQGGSVGAAHMRLRKRWYGFAGNYAYLSEKGDYVSEGDFGPTFSFASSSFIFSLQPSALVSGANDENQVWGAGLRTYTRFYMGQMFLMFDPLLGYINQNWQYHLKVGGGYRFTPNIGLILTFEYRDLVDFNDLNISDASLQSGMGYLQFRF